jgi:spermidine/putrescine transport system permease protein
MAAATTTLRRRARSWRPSTSALLVLPAVAWIVAFLVAPFAFPIYFSLGESQGFGGPNIGNFVTLTNYDRIADPLFRQIFERTLVQAAVGSLMVIAVGFPVAYFLARRAGRWKFVLLIAIAIPYWTSLLLRAYAWLIVLSEKGPVDSALSNVVTPPSILFSRWAVYLGLVYVYLPLAVFPMFARLERLDWSIHAASEDLGASPFTTLRSVTLPLALPGILAAVLLVFVPMCGEIAIPQLLGGGKQSFVGNLILDQFGSSRDWAFGAALGVSLVVGVALIAVACLLVLRRPMQRAEA